MTRDGSAKERAPDRAKSVPLRHVGLGKLVALCGAVGLSEERTRVVVETFGLVTASWGDLLIGDTPPWPNDITDDATPFEFSVAFHGDTPEIRFLAEPQKFPVAGGSSWLAGLELNQELSRSRRADTAAFDVVRDLFEPNAGATARFSLWHAAVIGRTGLPLFKAYVNPQIRGGETATRVVEHALRRLGRSDAWRFLAPRLADFRNVVRYVSLDLEKSPNARVKVYVGRTDSVDSVGRLVEGSANATPSEAAEWVERLANRRNGFNARPVLACFSFRPDESIPHVTLHVPVRSYLQSDADAAARVSSFLSPAQASQLTSALRAMTSCSLDSSRGLITYASVRRAADGNQRMTAYLAPRLYSTRDSSAPKGQRARSTSGTRRIGDGEPE
jgi:DMATS type aromatic prenyltransferase